MNLKIRDRRYVSHGDPKPDEGSRSAGTSAVHVSLSSDEIVKQQDRPIYNPYAKAQSQISQTITPWLTEPAEPSGSNGDASAPAAKSAATPSMDAV